MQAIIGITIRYTMPVRRGLNPSMKKVTMISFTR